MSMDGKFTTPLFSKSVATAAGAVCAVIAAGTMLGGGCGEEGRDAIFGQSNTSTAMALTSAVAADSGVDGMKFEIERVACANGEDFEEWDYEFSGSLEDMDLPAHLSVDHPLPADGSNHAFADHFVTLDAGCYNVKATPLNAEQPSNVCAPAFADGVEVEDGRTTEIMLLSQCEGEKKGALDVIAALNTAPHIEAIVYNPSKFAGVCEDVEICVTAVDPNNDPLDITFEQIGGPDNGGQPVSTGTSPAANGMTECFSVEPSAIGSYSYKASVYDLLEDENGTLIRFDDYLAQLGSSEGSYDDLTIPLHVGDTDEVYECSGEPEPQPEPEEPEEPDTEEPPVEEPGCVDYTAAQLRAAANCQFNGGSISFTLPSDACPEALSFSAYALNGKPITAYEAQEPFSNVTKDFFAGTNTATIPVPAACGYHVALYTNDSMTPLNPIHGHAGRLICADAEEDLTCNPPTPEEPEEPVTPEEPEEPDTPANPDMGNDDDGDDPDMGTDEPVDTPDEGTDDDDDTDDTDDGDDGEVCDVTDSCTLSNDMTDQGNAYADITVEFRCGEVYVESSKDLSNVVVQYADGRTHKYDDLNTGKAGTFGFDEEGTITTVWVKSGRYQSGDGPGYGVRFDLSSCSDD